MTEYEELAGIVREELSGQGGEGQGEKETPVYAEGMKYARLMEHTNPKIKVKLGLWDSGAVTSCIENPEDVPGVEESCYSTEAGQDGAFWAFIAHLSSNGFREHHVEVEE